MRIKRIIGILPLLLSAIACGVIAQAGDPQVALVDPAVLSRVRESYRNGDKFFLPAVKRLLRDSEKALDVKPLSVMDKEQVPPSGDKHDYMSMGKYWWPDPAKPDGMPYIRRDGESNPMAVKLTDHDELAVLIKGVSTLGLGFYFSGEEKYAAHAALLLRAWFLDPATRMNPNLNYAQAVPGRSDGRGAGIIDAHQLPELLDGAALLEGSASWSAADRQGLRDWFAAYLRWLRESDNGRQEAAAKNNHGTWYDVQVAATALFVGDTSIAASTVRGARAKRIATQIEPDGSQPAELQRTKSWDYSFFNLAGYFRLASLGERVKVDLWHYATADGRSIRKAVDWLLPFAADEKQWNHEQIVERKTTGIAPLLMKAAEVWSVDQYRIAAGKVKGTNLQTDRSLLFLRNM